MLQSTKQRERNIATRFQMKNENVESALEEGGFEIEGDCMVVQQ